jgi:hypothetical protein
MPTITYSCENFPSALGNTLQGTQTLTASWSEIVWAAISVGRRQIQHMFQYGRFSLFEITYRAAMIYANLRENTAGQIVRSSAYDGLDPSEKGAVSYFIGLTFAKLFAARLLGVPWVMHLDVYQEQLNPVLKGASRPDLVGLNVSGDWVVLEAKGRTNEFTEGTLFQAKLQSQQLSTLQGAAPVLRVGALTYFDNGTLEIAARDPEPDPEKNHLPDLPLTPAQLLETYYRPFNLWTEHSGVSAQFYDEGQTYRVVGLPEYEVTVGVPDFPPSPETFAVQSRKVRAGDRARKLRLTKSAYRATDGLIVDVGRIWSEANMQLEPQRRRP